MQNIVRIKIIKENKNIVNNLIKNNIYYKNISFFNDYVLIDTNINNVKLLKRVFKSKNIKIYKYYGILKYKNYINKYYISLISIVISLIIIYVLSNICFSINIETNNEKLKNIIKYELNNNNVKIYKFKKSYKQLEKIEENILKKNKDKLEWIEIEEDGTKYNVKLTERKLNPKPKIDGIRDIVSTKSGVIKKIIYKRGVAVKKVNDYVKKGEVIITGNIIKGEDELKAQVSADGVVYAEVWYIVNISVPYNYKELVKEEKFNRYYIRCFGNDMTLINYYKNNNYRIKTSKVLDKVYLPFDVYKEKVTKTTYKNQRLTKKQAVNKALVQATNKINITLDNSEYITNKKVLKKRYFRSKINVEVFIKTYENITGTSKLNVLEKGRIKSDT